MPRVNPHRSLENEENVASRIAYERERRAWSYEGLARRMVDAGSPIQASAIFKIEKGNPRRRITVDELVGFGRAFGLDVAELLLPVKVAMDREARVKLRERNKALNRVGAALADVRHLQAEIVSLDSGAVLRATGELVGEALARYKAEPPTIDDQDAYEVFTAPRSPVDKAFARLLDEITKEARKAATHGKH